MFSVSDYLCPIVDIFHSSGATDVLLFGAAEVYKNIFESNRFVERYRMSEIEHELGVTRDKCIKLAMLLGSGDRARRVAMTSHLNQRHPIAQPCQQITCFCLRKCNRLAIFLCLTLVFNARSPRSPLAPADYTDGVKGVGIVNAMEIVSAYTGARGLEEFREWIYSTDADVKPRPVGADANDAQKAAWVRAMFQYKHRHMRRKLEVGVRFPAPDVIRAYWHPTVDASPQPFEWALPELDALRAFCAHRLEWSAQRCDEKLVPVLDALTDGALTQRRLQYFFDFDAKAAEIRSVRLKQAVGGLTKRAVAVAAAAAAPVNAAAAAAAVGGSTSSSAAVDGTKAQAKSKVKGKPKVVVVDDDEDDDLIDITVPVSVAANDAANGRKKRKLATKSSSQLD